MREVEGARRGSRGLIETKWTIIVVERGTSPKVIICLSKGKNETLIAVYYIEVDQGNLTAVVS